MKNRFFHIHITKYPTFVCMKGRPSHIIIIKEMYSQQSHIIYFISIKGAYVFFFTIFISLISSVFSAV